MNPQKERVKLQGVGTRNRVFVVPFLLYRVVFFSDPFVDKYVEGSSGRRQLLAW